MRPFLTHFSLRLGFWTSAVAIIGFAMFVGELAGAEDEEEKDKYPSYRYAPMKGFSRMPYLQMSGADRMSIVWRTENAMTPIVPATRTTQP